AGGGAETPPPRARHAALAGEAEDLPQDRPHAPPGGDDRGVRLARGQGDGRLRDRDLAGHRRGEGAVRCAPGPPALMRRVALPAGLLALAPGVALARKGCAPGRFAARGPALVDPSVPAGTDEVLLVGRNVLVQSGCTPARARVRVKRRFTLVRARWSTC